MSTLTPGNYEIDAAHSNLTFSVRHAGVARVRGSMAVFSGNFTVADPIEQSETTVRIDSASVDTGNAQRDEHLRTADFWNAEQNPEWTFVSKSVSGDTNDLTVGGELTINNVTQPVTLSAELDGIGQGPEGEIRAAFAGTTSISRKDFGLSWNVALEGGGVLVSDKVNIELEVVGILQK